MKKLRHNAKRAVAVILSALMSASALSVITAIPAEAVSYDEMSALDQYAYSGDDLGAVYSKSSTTFKVIAEAAATFQRESILSAERKS